MYLRGVLRLKRRPVCVVLALASALTNVPTIARGEAPVTPAPAEVTVVVRLDTGERLCGTTRAPGASESDGGGHAVAAGASDSASVLVLDHPVLGRIVIRRDRIVAVTPVADGSGNGESTVGCASALVLPVPLNGVPGGVAEDQRGQKKAGTSVAVPAAPASSDGVTKEMVESAEKKGATEAPAAGVVVAAEQPTEVENGEESPSAVWGGELEAGFNGSEGNSPQSKLRVAGKATRKGDHHEVLLSASYSRASDGGGLSESRAMFEARHDRLLTDSRWQIFLDGSTELDEFKDYDARVTTSAGGGYRIIDSDRTDLLGRLGLGASQEIGGSNDQVIPEGQMGIEFERRLTDKQTLTSRMTVYPDFRRLGEFRAVGTLRWDLLVEEEIHLKLRFGIEDLYDSTPEGFKKNDIDYYASLVWGF